MTQTSYDILIAGGGSAGTSIAARLASLLPNARIGLIEPSQIHYYQPIWTLVGAGVFDRSISARQQADFIPEGVTWIQERVKAFDPDNNQVELESGKSLSYGELVVALGMQINWSAISGLEQTLGKNGVCSNYSFQSVQSTWEMLNAFSGGRAIFTYPATPIKCAGAPQKIMYLAEETFRERGIRNRSEVIYMSATPSIFGVPKYRKALESIVAKREIKTEFRQNLIEIRADKKEAVFEHLDSKEQSVKSYDLMHVTPPQGAPDVVKQSPLSNSDGWVEVHDHTLQHKRYPNVWSSGDCSSLPVSKTGAAIRKQVPILVDNLIAKLQGKPVAASYDGYASCPLVTGRGKTILAEFGYGGKIMETFPFDQAKERYSMYALKAYALPKLYWEGMLKGRI